MAVVQKGTELPTSHEVTGERWELLGSAGGYEGWLRGGRR